MLLLLGGKGNIMIVLPESYFLLRLFRLVHSSSSSSFLYMSVWSEKGRNEKERRRTLVARVYNGLFRTGWCQSFGLLALTAIVSCRGWLCPRKALFFLSFSLSLFLSGSLRRRSLKSSSGEKKVFTVELLPLFPLNSIHLLFLFLSKLQGEEDEEEEEEGKVVCQTRQRTMGDRVGSQKL